MPLRLLVVKAEHNTMRHAGAVRDMLQNHMLQVLSLIAMEPPCRLDAKEIRREKTKVLAAARLGQKTLFGQYVGYRDEEGVRSNSGPNLCRRRHLYR